jgi:curved DNA-binding protein CbpA
MKLNKLIFILLIMCPNICFGSPPVLLSAEQIKAIIAAHQALKDEPEKEQFGILLEEGPESFTVSFEKGIGKRTLTRGGGNRVIAYKISKENYEILSVKRYFSR